MPRIKDFTSIRGARCYVAELGEQEEGCYSELETWLLMFECACLNLEHKTAIMFS